VAKPAQFKNYLQQALDYALCDEREENDYGNLKWVHELSRKGVQQNWTELTAATFLKQYLWCVGSIQKKYCTHEKYYPSQKKLFRNCNAKRIASEAKLIRKEWETSKCDLNSRMLEAMIFTATEVAKGWDDFKTNNLLFPVNPESAAVDDWWEAYRALDDLRMVGDALAWYLVRNLYGAPFFKPDLHINTIASHFFGKTRNSLKELATAAVSAWPSVCNDKRFLPPHLGEIDYILWWFRQNTGLPKN